MGKRIKLQDISSAPKDGLTILALWGDFLFPSAWLEETEVEFVTRGIWPFRKKEKVERRISQWVPVIPHNGNAAVFWARMPTKQPTHWIGVDRFESYIEARDD